MLQEVPDFIFAECKKLKRNGISNFVAFIKGPSIRNARPTGSHIL